LTGDLIREGVAGVSGQVAEPFLDGAIRPDILFPAYVSGFNLVEAFYLAMPYLSWQAVIFGDPLCAPFRNPTVALADPIPPISPETELSPDFERRRIAGLMTTGVTAEAARYLLLGEARRRQGDEAGMREALEKATAAAPALIAAHFMLATAHEKAGEYDLAIERYRQVLVTTPGDPVAANNLAYALAVHKNAPKDALPIAEKAQAVSKGEARITDTLGWIHYLLGNFQQAGALLVEAAARAPTNPDIQLHLAHAYAALDRTDLAISALKQCIQLDASFAAREDVRALQAKLAN
jgi:Flp pilus assembly protein TadD